MTKYVKKRYNRRPHDCENDGYTFPLCLADGQMSPSVALLSCLIR